MWNAWGISWGSSWGSSWGPLHAVEEDYGWDTSQGIAGRNKPEERNYIAENLNRQYERKLRIERDNRLATEFIMMLVQTELLDG